MYSVIEKDHLRKGLLSSFYLKVTLKGFMHCLKTF